MNQAGPKAAGWITPPFLKGFYGGHNVPETEDPIDVNDVPLPYGAKIKYEQAKTGYTFPPSPVNAAMKIGRKPGMCA